MKTFNENVLSGLIFFWGTVAFILGYYVLSAMLLLTAAISVICFLSI